MGAIRERIEWRVTNWPGVFPCWNFETISKTTCFQLLFLLHVIDLGSHVCEDGSDIRQAAAPSPSRHALPALAGTRARRRQHQLPPTIAGSMVADDSGDESNDKLSPTEAQDKVLEEFNIKINERLALNEQREEWARLRSLMSDGIEPRLANAIKALDLEEKAASMMEQGYDDPIVIQHLASSPGALAEFAADTGLTIGEASALAFRLRTSAPVTAGSVAAKACLACGATEKVKACSRCKAVFFCNVQTLRWHTQCTNRLRWHTQCTRTLIACLFRAPRSLMHVHCRGVRATGGLSTARVARPQGRMRRSCPQASEAAASFPFP
jgi:hypothetical protein